MKNTKRIIAVLILSALLVASLAVGAFAALGTGDGKTGQGMEFSDYASVNFLVHDSFEGGDTGKTGSVTGRGTSGSVAGAVTVVSDDTGAPYIYDMDSTVSASKSYVKMDYSKNTEGTIYLEPAYNTLDKVKDNPSQTPLNGFVMEFDVCTKATSNNSWELTAQAMNTHAAADGQINVFKFYGNNGTAKVESLANIGSAKTSVTAAKAGGWIHITILYLPADSMIYVYANQAKVDRTGAVARTCIGAISNYDSKNSTWVYPLVMRMGKQDQRSGDFCIDNVLYYQATAICDPQYMSRLTPADAFVGNVSSVLNTSLSLPDRYAAYELIKSEYINTFWTGTAYTAAANTTAIKKAVDDFVAFDKSDAAKLKTDTMNYNVTQLTAKIKTLSDMKRGLANIADRATQISVIESYITTTGELFNKDNAEYATAITNFDTWKLYYTEDINIRTFVNRMDRFATATTSMSMQRHYDEATETYPSASAAKSMLTSMFTDSAERTKISSAITAYENAGTKLASAVKNNNAQRFINLVNLFKDTTQADWEADTDGTIRNQWYLARGILLENNYNADLSGFSTAKTSIYDPVNTYFSAKMQAEHVATLQAKLAVFEAAGSNYVDKAGVCKYIDNYLDRNAQDIVVDADITAIKNKNAEYKALLSGLEIDYTTQLIENTVEFVNQMANIANYTSYADLKPLFDEASDNYYNMNLIGNDSAGLDTAVVQSAVSAYEALKTRLLNVEVYSTQFVTQMADIPNVKYKDDYYAAFMVCFSCEEYLDDTFEGVSACKGQYDTMKSNYMDKIELANAESKSTIDSVCSVRTFCGIGDLVNHVQGLLK